MRFRTLRIRLTGMAAAIPILAMAGPAKSAPTASVVKILSRPNAVVQGQNVTLIAGVNWTATGLPTGTITVTDTVTCPGASAAMIAVLGAITLGSATSATPGAGTLTVSSFPCDGGNSLVASYSGDSNYAAGVSEPLLEAVLAQFTPTSTSLTSSINPSNAGQAVTFTAQLRFTISGNTYPTVPSRSRMRSAEMCWGPPTSRHPVAARQWPRQHL
jgi:Bacterial Ig-like domain (group 3)